MQNRTPFFDGFHIRTLSKKRETAAQRLARELRLVRKKSLSQLAECFHKFIPDDLLKPSSNKGHSRKTRAPLCKT